MEVTAALGVGDFVGESPGLRKVTQQIQLVAPTGAAVLVTLAALPAVGMHFLQIQNLDGLFSNDFIFHVAENEEAAAELERSIDHTQTGPVVALANAIAGATWPRPGNFSQTVRASTSGSRKADRPCSVTPRCAANSRS